MHGVYKSLNDKSLADVEETPPEEPVPVQDGAAQLDREETE